MCFVLCSICRRHRSSQRMPAKIPMYIVILRPVARCSSPVRKRHMQWHLYHDTVDAVLCQTPAQRRVGFLIHFSAGIKYQDVIRSRSVKQPGSLDLRYCHTLIALQRLHGFLSAMRIDGEITDTAKYIKRDPYRQDLQKSFSFRMINSSFADFDQKKDHTGCQQKTDHGCR